MEFMCCKALLWCVTLLWVAWALLRSDIAAVKALVCGEAKTKPIGVLL